MANCTINANTIQVFNNSNQKIFDAGVRMPTILASFSGTLSLPVLTLYYAPYFYGEYGGVVIWQGHRVHYTPYTIYSYNYTTYSADLLNNTKALVHLKITDNNLNFSQAKVPGMSGNWMFGNSFIYRSYLGEYTVSGTRPLTWLEMVYVTVDSTGIYIKRKAGIRGFWTATELVQMLGLANAQSNIQTPRTNDILGSSVTLDYKITLCREI